LKPENSNRDMESVLIDPIVKSTRNFYITVAILVALILWGTYAYLYQLRNGLGVTGLNQPVSWGFYVTNFVFFIGISHAGTLISAILRICNAEWRRPITRMAEVITVMVLAIGAGNILVDLGRPDRMFNVIFYGRYQSPLLWDATSISAYFTASTVYLWLPMIPDIAILRDRVTKWRWFYRILALGWTGTEKQKKALERGIKVMAVLVIPIAISVHSVVSFVFSMTLQPSWHSTIFGPYFVAGAIFSGIGALIIAMLIIRKVYHLEAFLKPVHFHHLGTLLLAMSLIWAYFTFSEYLTGFYGSEPEEMKVFWSKFNGPYAPFFWAMIVCNFVIPITLLSFRRTHTIAKTLIASCTVCVGMWLERFIIVVPTLANPRLHYGPGDYFPSWVEWAETSACFALFILFYMIFTKFFPIISMWEIREGREEGLQELDERVRSYLPESPQPELAIIGSTGAPLPEGGLP
jgi:molybdopterin-containing oxidoreductase family membrane subunit